MTRGTDQPTGRIIAALLRAGANPDGRHADGWPPLHHAVEGDAPNATAVRLLLAAGADRTIRDGEGKTALDLTRESEAGWEAIAAAGPSEFPPVPRMAPEQIPAMLALSLGQAREVVRRIGGDDSCR